MLRGRMIIRACWPAVALAACTPFASSAPPPVNSTGTGPATSTATPTTTATATATATPTATATSAPAPFSGPRAAFYAALRDLEAGRRKDHVRIMWLGDSHAQADFWTGGVRTALQTRFGDGGPGFIHLGMDHVRHDGVAFELEGSWRMRPKKPSTTEPWSDGAFGLGGILNAGYAGKRVAGITVKDPDLAGKNLIFELCFKAGTNHDEFDLTVDGETDAIEAHKGAGDLLHHVGRTSSADHRLVVRVKDGGPDFCGLRIETGLSEHPGVVLDNLGINGARYATALAWNEAAWIAEVRFRPPELFVFEYGGNEASDGTQRVAEYEKNAKELIARAKRAAPQASCLVIGPADRADRENQIPPIVDAMHRAADASGCMFWNTWAAMGGKGSLARWRDEHKAAADGIHLKPNGYAELSALLVQDLMAGYHRD